MHVQTANQANLGLKPIDNQYWLEAKHHNSNIIQTCCIKTALQMKLENVWFISRYVFNICT